MSPRTLGFLTVLDDEQDGLFGGYLVLNLLGRPLEFHCTAPLRPNRAQAILYGPTLEPYLYGEQIGQTLLAKSEAQPLVVCTDRPAALAVRELVDVPVALVLPPVSDEPVEASAATTTSDPSGRRIRFDAAHGLGSSLTTFQLGRNHLAVSATASGDQRMIAQRLATVADTFDLAEPFGRIREAIEEARCGGH
ncbi:MAG: hypothetical protein JW809_09285 [Pirellulales bacterium]|nr:hypothetical protein [Pirellulales bacterium]